MSLDRRRFCQTAALAALASPLAPAAAQAPALTPTDPARLRSVLDRVESVRAVKRLQQDLAQCIHHGVWAQAARLFTPNAVVVRGDRASGPAAVTRLLRRTFAGDAIDGLARGSVHSQLLASPVIQLNPLGDRASGRWHDVAMTGSLGGPAEWHGGIWLADYARTQSGWRIAGMRYHPILAGNYESGWHNVSPDIAPVPPDFTPDQASMPQDRVESLGPTVSGGPLSPAELARIAALGHEDAVRNLQHAYGYYAERKMWDDVVDLFAAGGTMIVYGQDEAQGREGIRAMLERLWGPAGLVQGELFDLPQWNVTVDLDGDHAGAYARGLELGQIGHNHGAAQWRLTSFGNRFVYEGGKWKIAAMRLYPDMATDYFKGWGESDLIGGTGPRLAPPFARAIKLPANLRAGPIGRRGGEKPSPLAQGDAASVLSAAAAWEACESVTSALGNYLNDSGWWEIGRMMAIDGSRKSPAAGFYKGRERISQMQLTRNGPVRRPRAFVPVHLRLQPVIHADPATETARLHSRLFQFNSAWQGEASMTGGYYEDRFILEDGMWKLARNDVNHLWRTLDYRGGWARVPDDPFEKGSPAPAAFLAKMPPDEPIDPTEYAPFPRISQVKFHYPNPVSGRLPPRSAD